MTNNTNKSQNNVEKFIKEYESNPLYVAAKFNIKNEVIPFNVQTEILDKLFDNLSLHNQNINFQLPFLKDLNLKGGFHVNFQNRLDEIPNQLLLKIMFSEINRIEKNTGSNNDFDIFKLFNMKLDRDSFYDIFNDKDSKSLAITYNKFINKIYNASIDIDSIPAPYSSDKLYLTGLAYLIKIQNNLLEKTKSIFSYSKLEDNRKIILDAFSNNIKAHISRNPSELKHEFEANSYKKFSEMLFEFNPIMFSYLNQRYGIVLPSSMKTQYLIYNANNLNEDRFKYFNYAFKKFNTLDYDIVNNDAQKFINNLTSRGIKVESQLLKNIELFSKTGLTGDDDIYEKISKEDIKKNPTSSYKP